MIDIASLNLIRGYLSRRALELAMDWAELHRAELMNNWERMRNAEAHNKIDPLE